jgi:hypothetical protein
MGFHILFHTVEERFNIEMESVCENRKRTDKPLRLVGEYKIKYIKNCLALYCYDYLENIGIVYPAMSMIVMGHSLSRLSAVEADGCQVSRPLRGLP